MPQLNTPLHLNMYRLGKRDMALTARIRQALNILFGRGEIYGLHWGDPETSPPLTYIRDKFLLPYVNNTATVVEIGPGGGRWTRYMLAANKLYAVDYHQELLDELRRRFSDSRIVYIKNNGSDFPGVADHVIDFLFSFGTFVHLDIDIIDAYLGNIRRLLKPNSNVVIQYSDKTKPMAAKNQGFAQNDPETMRRLVRSHGYVIYEEDVQTLWHSAVVRFGIRESDA